MDQKVCKHLHCKKKNNNTECIRNKFSKISKQNSGIGRETADLNDMFINRSTYLNNFNKQKKISVSDKDYIFQDRDNKSHLNNHKGDILQSEIYQEYPYGKNSQNESLKQGENYYKDDGRMFVYYQKPKESLKQFKMDNNNDTNTLIYLSIKVKKQLAKNLLQFVQQYQQRYIIENQILKSQLVTESKLDDQQDDNFISIKGVKISQQKDEDIDYFDLQNNDNLNDQAILQENQKFKNTLTNLNEELKQAKLSLKQNFSDQKPQKNQKDVSEVDDTSYFEKLDNQEVQDYSALNKSKRNSDVSDIQNLNLQSYFDQQKEKEKGRRDRQRVLNKRRQSRQIVQQDLQPQNQVEQPKPTKRFSFIQSIQQGFQRNKRLSDSGIVFQEEPQKQIQQSEPVDELEEILGNKKILSEEDEEFFNEFAPKKIDQDFQKQLNKSGDDLFSPKNFKQNNNFSDEEEDYFYKEHKENLFHESLDEHNFRMAGGQREIQIDFVNQNNNLSLSGDENTTNDFDTQKKEQKQSGFIQSKRFTLGKLDDVINQIRRESIKDQQQIQMQTVADEFVEELMDNALTKIQQEKQQQNTNNSQIVQKSILLSKMENQQSQILQDTAKKNSMKLIKNLILEKQNQILAYNIMQQDIQVRNSLNTNSELKENVSLNTQPKTQLVDILQKKDQQNTQQQHADKKDLKEVKEKVSDNSSICTDTEESSEEDEDAISNRKIQTSINEQINEKLQEQFEENRRYSNLAKKSLLELYSNEMTNILEEEEQQEQKQQQKKRLSKFINEEYELIQSSVREILNDENLEHQKQRRVSEMIDQNLENVRKTVLLQIDEEEQQKLDQLVEDNLQQVRTSVHELIHQEIKDQQKIKKLDEEIDEKFDDLIEDEIQRQISNSVHENLEQQYQEKRRASSCVKQRLSDIYDDSMQTYMEEVQKDEELEEFINRNLALTKTSVLEIIYEEEEDQKITELVEDNLNLARFSVQQILDKEVKNEKKKKRLSKMVENEVNQIYLKQIQKQVNTEIVKSMYEQDIQKRKSTLKNSQIEIKNQDKQKEAKEETRQSLANAALKIKQILDMEIPDENQSRRLSLMVDDNLEQIKKFSIKQNKKEEKERRRLSTMVSQNLDNIVNREIQKSINTQIQLDMLKQAEEERRNSLIAKKTLTEIVNKEIQKQINEELMNSMTQQELQEFEMDDLINENLESLKDIQIRKTINEGKLKQDIQEEIEAQKIAEKSKKRLSIMVDENFEDVVRQSIRLTLKEQKCSLKEIKDVDQNQNNKNFNTQRNSLDNSSQQTQDLEQQKIIKKKPQKKRSSFFKKDFQYEIIDDQINQIPKQIVEENQEPIYRRKTTIPEDKFVARQSFINNDINIPLVRPKLNSVVVNKKQTLVKQNSNDNRPSIRPKMNSIVINKKSIHNNLYLQENETFIRPKLNSIVMNKPPKVDDTTANEQERVRPKMNSIVIHKKSTVVQRPIIEENEVFVRPKLNSFVMQQRPTLKKQSLLEEDARVRPKMNSIIIHKKSTVVQRPLIENEEAFVRPKLNSLVMNQRPTIARQSINQDIEKVRPKMNSIVMHKKSTVVQRPIIEENEVFVRPKLNSLVINQNQQYIESNQNLKENEQQIKSKISALSMPKKSVISNTSEDIERIRNLSNQSNDTFKFRNMTNYQIEPIEEEELEIENINLKLCSKNLRKLTKKLIKEQKLEMKNAMVDHMLDKPRKESRNKRQSIQFDQFLKRNSKINNIRFSVNPLFNLQTQKEIKEEIPQKSRNDSEKKKSSIEEECNLQAQILSINNVSKLIDKTVDRINEQFTAQKNNNTKTQLVTTDTLENLDATKQSKLQREQNIFQSQEFPYQNAQPEVHKQSINIKASGFDNQEIIEDDNSISWINKKSMPQKNNSLSTKSNQRMSTKIIKKSPTEYEMKSIKIENLEDQNVNRKTTLDNRNLKQSEIITKQNSIGDLDNDEEEEINELVIKKKLSKENSKGNLFKKNQKQFENYSFHSVIFKEEHSPELGTHGFKSQLALNKQNQNKKRNTVENFNKWKEYIQDYNMKMMDKMNKAFSKNQDAKQSSLLLDELMSQKIDYDYLIFCLNIDKKQIDKIQKFQKFYRQRLNKKIIKKIKEGQDIFKRETNLIHIRRTNLF